MAKGLIDTILDSIFDENWVGCRGEKLTERELKLVNLFGRKGKTLRNLYVPKDNGETSEIDVVYITQKGIFVFESKTIPDGSLGMKKECTGLFHCQTARKIAFIIPSSRTEHT